MTPPHSAHIPRLGTRTPRPGTAYGNFPTSKQFFRSPNSLCASAAVKCHCVASCDLCSSARCCVVIGAFRTMYLKSGFRFSPRWHTRRAGYAVATSVGTARSATTMSSPPAGSILFGGPPSSDRPSQGAAKYRVINGNLACHGRVDGWKGGRQAACEASHDPQPTQLTSCVATHPNTQHVPVPGGSCSAFADNAQSLSTAVFQRLPCARMCELCELRCCVSSISF